MRAFLLLFLVLAACSGGTGDSTPVDMQIGEAATPSDDGVHSDLSIDAFHGEAGMAMDLGSMDAGPVIDAGCSHGPAASSAASIDVSCSSDPLACPSGYTCFTIEGVVAQPECEIACTSNCDCPNPSTCGVLTDKAGPHMLCRAGTP